MATKTFKIGEYARGGIITAETSKTHAIVIAKEWDYSKGSRRSSDQSQAKELYRLEVALNDSEIVYKLSQWLCEESTSYYSDQIIEWIKSKTNLKSVW